MAEKMIISFYDKSGNIRPDLFDTVAEHIAKTFAAVRMENNREKRNGVTSTQIRRLFNEVKRYDRLISDEKSWIEQKPFIKMIKAKVHYTIARCKKNDKNNAPYYDNLSAFLTEGIDLVNTAKDYRVFVSLFEAVYGFYYENRPDMKN